MKTWMVGLTLLAAACGSKEEPPPPSSAPQGRAETQSIRNTEAVGYSGNAIADKVDGALKTNEEQVEKAEKASEAEPE